MAIGTTPNKTKRYSRHTYGDNGAYGLRNLCSVSFVANDLRRPIAAGAAVVSAAITSSNAAVTTGSLSVTLDTPRNVTITPGGTLASVSALPITITGTNVEGAVITETLTPTAGAATLVVGNKAFKTVTAYSIPTQTGAGATYSIGVGSKLGIGLRNITGMPVKIVTAATIAATNAGTYTIEDPAASALSATVVENNTVTPASTLDGVRAIRVYTLNYNWAVNPINGNPNYGV